MLVEVWSDVTCPWCGIGHHRLQQALEKFEHAAAVEVVFRSFALNKHAPENTTWPMREHLMGKYGLAGEAADANMTKIEQIAAGDGLAPYRLHDNVVGNTLLAHELLAHAKEQGRGPEAWARLFRAYFSDCISVFDVDSLVELGAEIGLDTRELRAALEDRRYRRAVEQDDHIARARGIEGVPFFLFAGRFALPGADTVETLLRGLELGWEHANQAPTEVLASTGARCDETGCEIR
jgi:predicted DsbA family dithiol-disulfide isomerase